MKLKYNEIQEWRAKLLAKQNNLCYLCRQPIDARDAVLDHDHDTGRIRAVLHSQCNVLLGKVENHVSRKGKIMATQKRAEQALANIWNFMQTDWSDNPLHPTHKSPTDKLRLKYTRLYRKSKKAATKAKYRKLIEDL